MNENNPKLLLALQKALNKETRYSSASEKEIFDKFEELFEKGDGREMGTLRLCGHNKPEDDYLKAILVDNIFLTISVSVCSSKACVK